MLTLFVLAYAVAMTLANLLVSFTLARNPAALPYVVAANAFVLIGLDLALRDLLHLRLGRNWLLALIVASGIATYALNPAAGRIAAASAIAFSCAAAVDWLVFFAARGTWLQRSVKSNVAGAAVDSILFPLIAAWPALPLSLLSAGAALMFAAKVAGGAMWSWTLARLLKIAGARA